MINELQQDLKRLLIDPNDLFHFHVRARLGKKATDHFERKVKEFILRMPSVVSRIDALLIGKHEDSDAKCLARSLLIYLYDPTDFLPERDNGLFGYLDDAYFTAIVYLIMLQKMDLSHIVDEDKMLREWIAVHLEPIRYLIPEESKKIEKIVSEMKLFNAVGRNEIAGWGHHGRMSNI